MQRLFEWGKSSVSLTLLQSLDQFFQDPKNCTLDVSVLFQPIVRGSTIVSEGADGGSPQDEGRPLTFCANVQPQPFLSKTFVEEAKTFGCTRKNRLGHNGTRIVKRLRHRCVEVDAGSFPPTATSQKCYPAPHHYHKRLRIQLMLLYSAAQWCFLYGSLFNEDCRSSKSLGKSLKSIVVLIIGALNRTYSGSQDGFDYETLNYSQICS